MTFISKLNLGAGVILGAVMFGVPLYQVGYQAGEAAGRKEAAVQALSNSVEALRDRGKIDDQVSTSDATAMCADLGMRGDDLRECVRRVETTDPVIKHSGGDYQG